MYCLGNYWQQGWRKEGNVTSDEALNCYMVTDHSAHFMGYSFRLAARDGYTHHSHTQIITCWQGQDICKINASTIVCGYN